MKGWILSESFYLRFSVGTYTGMKGTFFFPDVRRKFKRWRVLYEWLKRTANKSACWRVRVLDVLMMTAAPLVSDISSWATKCRNALETFFFWSHRLPFLVLIAKGEILCCVVSCAFVCLVISSLPLGQLPFFPPRQPLLAYFPVLIAWNVAFCCGPSTKLHRNFLSGYFSKFCLAFRKPSATESPWPSHVEILIVLIVYFG